MSDHNRNLRLDRRLVRRRGWIAPEELEQELAALPDASGNILPPEEDEGAGPSGSRGGSAGPATGA